LARGLKKPGFYFNLRCELNILAKNPVSDSRTGFKAVILREPKNLWFLRGDNNVILSF